MKNTIQFHQQPSVLMDKERNGEQNFKTLLKTNNELILIIFEDVILKAHIGCLTATLCFVPTGSTQSGLLYIFIRIVLRSRKLSFIWYSA